ncbi:D-alanine--D-alanine ligase [gamma proteobacterium IMCC2047]|nr:D-alanine--D-alanine ligase [gamma proteobacterium IMCC2047]
MGGRAAERDISLVSGKAVLSALLAAGVDAFAIDAFGPEGTDSLIEQLSAQPVDTVFNMVHGGEGENGSIPCLLAAMNLPVTGSAMAASALAMNKSQCKFLWQGMALPTARFQVLSAESDWQQVVDDLGLPLMVKPGSEGSSIGMSKVDRVEDLKAAYEEAVQYDQTVIAESWITGGEYTVGIIKGQPLPGIKLETAREFYDYQAKYVDDDTQYLIPCGLSPEKEQAMQAIALRAFDSLGCRGWGRVDLMLDEARDEFLVLEVNTIPGMTDHSLVPMAAASIGLSFDALVLQILSTAN